MTVLKDQINIILKSKIENNSLKKEKKSICFNRNLANELGEFLCFSTIAAMRGTY